MKSAVLCLTATIRPNTGQVSRANVNERLADYKKCIKFYLEHTVLPVYFLENSNYDLDGDAVFDVFLKDERFHLLRFAPHPDTSKGKGFQEFYMLDRFVKNYVQAGLMIKVTGRYIVKNIDSLLSRLGAPLSMDLHKKMKVGITGFFAIDSSLYLEHFYEKYRLANDAEGRYIEHVLYDTIMNSELRHQSRLLPENPQYEGVSGSYGGSLARNPYKMKVRSIERRLNRNLGIPQFLIEY